MIDYITKNIVPESRASYMLPQKEPWSTGGMINWESCVPDALNKQGIFSPSPTFQTHLT